MTNPEWEVDPQIPTYIFRCIKYFIIFLSGIGARKRLLFEKIYVPLPIPRDISEGEESAKF